MINNQVGLEVIIVYNHYRTSLGPEKNMLQPKYDLRGVRFSQHGNVCCEEKWEEAGPGTWDSHRKGQPSCNDPQIMQSGIVKMPFCSLALQ